MRETKMTTPGQPWLAARRPAASRIAPLYDPVRAARGWVHRRARGMDAGAVARALAEARFDARQDSQHEDLAGDEHRPAELGSGRGSRSCSSPRPRTGAGHVGIVRIDAV
ncbi:hypothetical protein [Streptomyces sp. NBC_01190]|uniref:hypothetical protein n=1 Tax=Streptomyces sp. NBC_01190 TaxID=2903767 RepID=UPI00386F472D|nr:hypothetical protein OG519_29445 [Streptomyces sp. NBC_01190]